MALSHRHRNAIYLGLREIIGDEEAEALLSQFPLDELHEPATKEFVRAELSGLRSDLMAQINGVRSDLDSKIGGLRVEMSERFRQQTIWLTGVLISGMGGISAIVAAIG